MKLFNAINKTVLTLATTALLSTTASAAVNFSGNMGEFYSGVKVGQTATTSESKVMDLDNATAFGVYAGYTHDSNLGVELEYLTTQGGEYVLPLDIRGDYQNESLGAYATYRLPIVNGLYAKGKLGYGISNVTLDENEDTQYDSHGIAGGIGLGMNVAPNIDLEAEFAMLPTVEIGDTDFDTGVLSVGANFKF